MGIKDYIGADQDKLKATVNEAVEKYKEAACGVSAETVQRAKSNPGNQKMTDDEKEAAKHYLSLIVQDLQKKLNEYVFDNLTKMLIDGQGIDGYHLQTVQRNLNELFNGERLHQLLESQGESYKRVHIDQIIKVLNPVKEEINKLLQRYASHLDCDQKKTLELLNKCLGEYEKDNGQTADAPKDRVEHFRSMINTYNEQSASFQTHKQAQATFIKIMDFVGRVASGEDYNTGHGAINAITRGLSNLVFGTSASSLKDVLVREFAPVAAPAADASAAAGGGAASRPIVSPAYAAATSSALAAATASRPPLAPPGPSAAAIYMPREPGVVYGDEARRRAMLAGSTPMVATGMGPRSNAMDSDTDSSDDDDIYCGQSRAGNQYTGVGRRRLG